MPEVTHIAAPPHIDRDRLAFEAAPIAMWQEDFSDVEALCDDLRAAGVTDIREALQGDRALLVDAISRIHIVDVNEAAVALAGAADRSELIGSIPASLLSEGAYSAFIEQIATVWEREPALELILDGTDFAGHRLDCNLYWAAPKPGGRVDYSRVVVMIQDVTERRQAKRRAQQQAEQLAVLLEMGRQISSSLDIDTTLERINDAVVESVGSDASILLLFDADRQTLTHAAGRNYPEAELNTHSVQEILEGISGWVVRGGRSTVSEDIATDPRNTGLALERAQRSAGTTVAVAPIISETGVVGTLTALNNPPSAPFTEAEMALVETLAAQAAVAIQNARLYAEINEAHSALKDTQAKLLQAQKLEAIGSLAAGIAHEINTPIQYVGDNTRFLMEAAEATFAVLDAAEEVVTAAESGSDTSAALAALADVKESSEFEYMVSEVPEAFEQTIEGIDRVASIVQALKEFAHPGTDSKTSVDLNRALHITAEVSRSEWKYCAEIEFDLDENLPLVPAHSGPLNQAFLILIVNAAQAIESSFDKTGEDRGTIRITTRSLDDHVEVRVNDSGPGVPPDVVARIFDPFFTTKGVGQGSGQGLSIARSVLIDKHDGDLFYDDSGPGATFVIHLPLSDEENEPV